MSQIRQDPCTAEIIIADGESFVIDQRLDIIASKAKTKTRDWIADWGGCRGIKPHSLSADTRQEVIDKMVDHIRRRKALRDLREYFEIRAAKQALREQNAPVSDT